MGADLFFTQGPWRVPDLYASVVIPNCDSCSVRAEDETANEIRMCFQIQRFLPCHGVPDFDRPIRTCSRQSSPIGSEIGNDLIGGCQYLLTIDNIPELDDDRMLPSRVLVALKG